MKITLFQIKLVHTLIFWILSLCVVHALVSGIADDITTFLPGDREVKRLAGAPEAPHAAAGGRFAGSPVQARG